jgi:hypothetical protein
MDTILLLSIFLVFITALLGAFINRRKCDRVLTDLQGFHTTAKLTDGTLVWGRAEIFPNGIELIYSRPYINKRGHAVTSYILFKEAIDSIQTLYRYHTELTAANQVSRIEEVERAANPDLLQRSSRHTRNFLNTFRDAINESMNMFLSRMKGASSSMLFRTQDAQLKKMSTSVLGAVGSAYDPILERYIGRRVVVELHPETGASEEFCGVLKEYSPAWMSILDCRIAEERKLPLADTARLKLQRDMDFRVRLEQGNETCSSITLTVWVENHASEPVRLRQVEAEAYEYPLNIDLACGETYEWTMQDLPATSLAEIDMANLPIELVLTCPERRNTTESDNGSTQASELPVLPDLVLAFESMREADAYIPRSLGTLRHGNEFIEENRGRPLPHADK